jgi:hypothetical protein
LKKHSVFIEVKQSEMNAGTPGLQNVGKYSPNNTTLLPRRLEWSAMLLQEPHILHCQGVDGE